MLRKEGTDASLGGGLQTAEPPKVTVTKLIMPHGNHGKDAKLLPKPPASEPDPDSADPDGDAPSSDVGQYALSKRNARGGGNVRPGRCEVYLVSGEQEEAAWLLVLAGGSGFYAGRASAVFMLVKQFGPATSPRLVAGPQAFAASQGHDGVSGGVETWRARAHESPIRPSANL